MVTEEKRVSGQIIGDKVREQWAQTMKDFVVTVKIFSFILLYKIC